MQDKCDLIDSFQIGDDIKVNFNIRGRRWENPKTNEIRFFNSLDAWRIEKVNQESTTNDLPPMPSAEPVNIDDSEADDLPF